MWHYGLLSHIPVSTSGPYQAYIAFSVNGLRQWRPKAVLDVDT